MWPCFICGSDRACEHREINLLFWFVKLQHDERSNAIAQAMARRPVKLQAIERKPPARATEAAEASAERVRAAGGGD